MARIWMPHNILWIKITGKEINWSSLRNLQKWKQGIAEDVHVETPSSRRQRRDQSNAGLEYAEGHPEIWELRSGDEPQLKRVQAWYAQQDLWLQSYVHEIYL